MKSKIHEDQKSIRMMCNKDYIILSFVLFISSFCLHAQVVNGNFETVKPNFLPSNWGMNFSLPAFIDIATGQSFTNNIQFTWCIPSMVYASTDARSGQYAMEVSNAFNTASSNFETDLSKAKAISEYEILMVFGIPVIKSRPLIS